MQALISLALISAPVSSHEPDASSRSLVNKAVSDLFMGGRCVPASRPGGGPDASYFEQHLFKARFYAAVKLLNESGDNIDLESIEADFEQSLFGVVFIDCKRQDRHSSRARKSFKLNVVELEKRAVKAAVTKQEAVKDFDGDGVISTISPHIN